MYVRVLALHNSNGDYINACDKDDKSGLHKENKRNQSMFAENRNRLHRPIKYAQCATIFIYYGELCKL